MANLFEDIQCAGSDTRPPMLDKTDFTSWQQRIRLYCRGKDNGVNILKSIDEGPYILGTFRETLAESTEGTPQFGPERPRVYPDLNSNERDQYNADIRATNILLQGLPKDIYTLINHCTDAKDIWDNVKMLLEGSELTKEDRVIVESKIMTNIIKNHPLQFNIAASSSVPWIYMAQFCHTLKEDGSKYRLKFMLDRVAMGRNSLFSSLFNIFDSLSKIHEDHHCVPTRSTVIRLRLPQRKSTSLIPPAPVLMVDKAEELILKDTLQEIEKMVEGEEHVVDDSSIPRNDEHNIPGIRLEPKSDKKSPEVGITDVIVPVNVYDEEEEADEITDEELTVPHTTPSSSSPSNKLSHTNRLLSLFKFKPARFKRYKSFFQELQGRYEYLFEHLRAKFMPRKSFVTLADHLHEAMADSLPTMVDKHTKEQVPEQVRNQVPVYVAKGNVKQSKLKRYKDKVGMKIPDWMISEEMKQTEHYRKYLEVFGIHVPLIQSPLTESTQGTHRTPSAPKSPTPKVDAAESSVPTRSTVIHLRLPQRKSTSLIPPAPVLMVDKAEELLLKDTLQIEKMVEGEEHVVDDSLIPRNDEHNILGTRLEPMSNKKSPEVGITDVIVPVNVYDEEEEADEITDETKEEMEKMIAKAILQELQLQTTSVPEQQYQLYLSMKDDPQWQKQDITIWLALWMKFERLQVPQTTCRTLAVHPRDQDDPHDDAHPERENNDDEIPTKQVSQNIMEAVSLNVDEAKLKKIAHEMLRQRCTSGDEHQYHIDQMKNFLKSDIRDPEAPTLSLINQDLLYLKKGNLGPEKIVLSLHKFSAVVFNDDDIKEQTSRWVNKKQKEPGKPKEVIYLNSEIIQVIKTYWELGHEHKFITKIIARRANDCIVSITEPDFKNLNKNDIEDMYLLIMNGKVPDYAETGLLWSLSVFIRSSVIWERA
nr:Gag-protease polyprotein [Tanacetum cinerariifolium]